MDAARELLFGAADLRTIVVWFFVLRLGLPVVMSIVLSAFKLKRKLTISEDRLIQQRLSRLALAVLLVSVSVRALLSVNVLSPLHPVG